MWRKLKRLAVCVALVCGLLGLCTYIARDPVRDVLGRIASAWLSRSLNGTLEIGTLRGSLWSSLVLRDVVLRDRAGMEVAQLDEVRFGYDLTTLLTKRLVVQSIHLVHPQATLVQDPEGQWNLSRVLAPASPADPPPAGGPRGGQAGRRGCAGVSGELGSVVLVPHTHWDREWYEPFQVFRLRLVDGLDDVGARAEADPDVRFTVDGQMAAVGDYLEIRPECRARVSRSARQRPR